MISTHTAIATEGKSTMNGFFQSKGLNQPSGGSMAVVPRPLRKAGGGAL